MAETPSDNKDSNSGLPAPEVLKPQGEEKPAPAAAPSGDNGAKQAKRLRPRGSYRPSHKATFISLGVIVAILAINAGVIAFVLKSQADVKSQVQGQVTISQADLSKLGVDRGNVGNAGISLTVNPNAKFNGNVDIGGDLSVAGKLTLNGGFSAASGNFAKLQAGDTSLQQLTVNGDGTFTNLALRKDLTVAGITRLQGPAVFSQLLTVNNSVNIAGNLAVGGTLSVMSFHASSLVSDNGIVTGGHIITQGASPGVSAGGAVGSNGTVSISGNDIAGTVAVNVGVGAVAGIVANVTFRSGYSNTPHVVVTAIGPGVQSFYINRNANGFSIGVNSPLSPGGYGFDYIVQQ
jgi:stage V sporulation protein SpoVS